MFALFKLQKSYSNKQLFLTIFLAQLARAGHVAVGSGASSGTASSGAASRSTTSCM